MSRSGNHENLLRDVPAAKAVLEAHELKLRAKKQRSELEAVIKQLQQQNSELSRALEALLGAAETVGADAPPIRPLVRKAGTLPEATYVAMASDWHMGSFVRAREVRHLNEYTPDIASARAERFFQSNLIMLQAARSAWNVNQLLLWLGGDLMENFLHEENLSENVLSPTEEVILVYETFARGIRFVLDHYDVERVLIATSNGNHGRNTKKSHAAGAFRSSYEFMVYQLLQKHFADEPRISWQLGIGYENIVDVYGFRIRFHHGDAIKFGGGVGGIAPALYRRVHRANSSGDATQLDVLGHFHALGFMPGAFVNGSLIGYSAFAQRLGMPFEEPAQGSFIIDAKHRVPSNMNPIFVKEPRRTSK